jgi:hypothetical protein
MSELAYELQHERYRQCVALYKQAKLAECLGLCLRNISDPDITRYFHIKTLYLLAGVNRWSQSRRKVINSRRLSGIHHVHANRNQRYRDEAEELFEATAKLARGKSKTVGVTAAVEVGLQAFRRELNGMLGWPFYDTPRDVSGDPSFGKPPFPLRQGSLESILFTRQDSAEDDGDMGCDTDANEGEHEAEEIETSVERTCCICK